jgi:hypothetical protein
MSVPNENILLVLHELNKVKKAPTKKMAKNLQKRINSKKINLDELLKFVSIK